MPHCNFLLLLVSLRLSPPDYLCRPPSPSPSLRPISLLFFCKPLMVISCADCVNAFSLTVSASAVVELSPALSRIVSCQMNSRDTAWERCLEMKVCGVVLHVRMDGFLLPMTELHATGLSFQRAGCFLMWRFDNVRARIHMHTHSVSSLLDPHQRARTKVFSRMGARDT